MAKRVYVAVSGFGGDTEHVLTIAIGPRDATMILAEQAIDRDYPDRTNIHNDTLRKNLRIVPLGQLGRTARGRWMIDAYLDHLTEETRDGTHRLDRRHIALVRK
jgi:hypothetical protein